MPHSTLQSPVAAPTAPSQHSPEPRITPSAAPQSPQYQLGPQHQSLWGAQDPQVEGPGWLRLPHSGGPVGLVGVTWVPPPTLLTPPSDRHHRDGTKGHCAGTGRGWGRLGGTGGVWR